MPSMFFGVLLCASAVLANNGVKYYTLKTADDLINMGSGSYFSGEYEEYGNGSPAFDEMGLRPIDNAVNALFIIITAVGLIANAVVFFVIFAGNEIGKTVTTIYVLQLIIANTFFLFTLPIFSMQKFSNDWAFGEGLCRLCQTIKFMSYYAGIFFLTAMSVDRYVAVAYSTRLAQVRTKRRTYFVVLCVWISAALMSIPIILYSGIDENSKMTFCRIMFPGYVKWNENSVIFTEECYFSGASDDTTGPPIFDEYGVQGSGEDYQDGEGFTYMCDHHLQPKSYRIWIGVDFAVAFVIPFAVIVFSYALIMMHRRGKNEGEKFGHTSSNGATIMRRKVTKMVAAMVICFTLCWLPHHVLSLMKIKGFPSAVPPCYALEEFFIALAFSNSALNPLLYTFIGINFRERLRKRVQNARFVVERRTSSTRGISHQRSSMGATRIGRRRKPESRKLLRS